MRQGWQHVAGSEQAGRGANRFGRNDFLDVQQLDAPVYLVSFAIAGSSPTPEQSGT
jgi:hypothetical protein